MMTTARSARALAAALLASACLVPSALAGASEEAKLVAPAGAPDDRFGSAVAIDGATAVVGAPRHVEGSIRSGAAYVYVASGSSWSLQQVLVPSDPASNQWFGGAVAIDGDALVVGAPYDPESGHLAGAAYVFRRSGAAWTQEKKLLPSNAADIDYFGYSVSIDGDRVLVGAPLKHAAGFGSGTAYVFVRSTGIWSQEYQLLPNDPATGDVFGWAVSLSDDRAAVGANLEDNAAGGEAGSAYVFARSGSSWTQEAKLVATGSGQNDQLGTSIALHGATLVVGAPLDDDNGTDAGAAYVFMRSGTVWSQHSKLVADDGGTLDHFGNAVAMRGATIAVGAMHPDNFGTHEGAAYLFEFDGSSWHQSAKLVGSDSVVDDWFGSYVSLSSERLLAGAMQHAGEGAAYVFRRGPASEVYCFGDGSGSACPCLNHSAPGSGQGCTNSSGLGAELAGRGSPSVAADDLAFDASNLRPGQPALLFAGLNAVNGGAGAPFGDGLRCAGGGVVRLGVRFPDAMGQASWGPGLGASGGWSAGDTRRFQCWYRDPAGSPCGTNFNLSPGVAVTFGS